MLAMRVFISSSLVISWSTTPDDWAIDMDSLRMPPGPHVFRDQVLMCRNLYASDDCWDSASRFLFIFSGSDELSFTVMTTTSFHKTGPDEEGFVMMLLQQSGNTPKEELVCWPWNSRLRGLRFSRFGMSS